MLDAFGGNIRGPLSVFFTSVPLRHLAPQIDQNRSVLPRRNQYIPIPRTGVCVRGAAVPIASLGPNLNARQPRPRAVRVPAMPGGGRLAVLILMVAISALARGQPHNADPIDPRHHLDARCPSAVALHPNLPIGMMA